MKMQRNEQFEPKNRRQEKQTVGGGNMKGFVKLTKETWRFYLAVLAVSLLLVISNSLYLCSEMKFKYVNDESSFHSDGVVFYSLIEDKADNSDLLGFYVVVAGIVLILLIRHFVFITQRTREFQNLLPVKHRTWVIHDFVFLAGIITISFFGMTWVFLAAQTRYNRDMLEAAKLHHIEGMKDDIVMTANTVMLRGILYYFIFVLFALSLLYLGMLVCRNNLIGGITTITVWRVLSGCLNKIYYYAGEGNRSIKWLAASIDPSVFFERSEGWLKECSSILLTLGFTICFVLLIVAAAGKIELSRGKLFYFSPLKYLFYAFWGVLAAFGVSSEAVTPEKSVVSFVSTIIVLTVIFILCGVYSKKQRLTKEWEVK